MISYFLSAAASYSTNFFIEEEESFTPFSESSLIPIMFIIGFIFSLIAIYFLRKRFKKKFKKIELKKKHNK